MKWSRDEALGSCEGQGGIPISKSAAPGAYGRTADTGAAAGSESRPPAIHRLKHGSEPIRPEGPPPVVGVPTSTNRTATASVGEATGRPIPSDFPPVVYLPCAEAVVDPKDARVDMRETRDGRTALLAYSALDRLHDCCGSEQPWILMPTSALSQLQAARPFQLLLLDVDIPVEKRRGAR